MSRRVEDVRKRIQKRKRQSEVNYNRRLIPMVDYDSEMEPSIFESNPKETIHPLWNRNVFLLKTFCAAVIFLLVTMIFHSPAPALDQARTVVKHTMETEFQFAAVGDWYEQTFGKPLALLPSVKEDVEGKQEQSVFALPATGKVIEDFEVDGRGIMLESGIGEQVKATSEGVVIFAGKNAELGDTVIIQHADQSESWYGRLDAISVKPHERVKAGTVLGTVSADDGISSGIFYFAIKQNDKFIDPIQVMKFE